MWARIITAMLLLTTLPVPLAQAAWTSFQASNSSAASLPAVVCNFQTGVATGVGASTCVNPTSTCDGTTDNTAAFAAFANWAINTWQVSHSGQIELFIPSGLTCTLDTASILHGFDGVLNLLVSGYGATLKSQTNGYFHLGSKGYIQDSSHSVRLNTANAGDTTITINPSAATQPASGTPLFGCGTIAACAGLFTVGNLAIIAGFDLQGGIGTPPNNFYYEYITPTNINTSTGVITLSVPLKYSYKTTWPQFGFGGGTAGDNFDPGGPATIFALPASYNATFEYDGLIFVQVANGNDEADIGGRTIIMKDATWTFNGEGCFFPTVNFSVTISNVIGANCTMEVDKFIGTLTITNSTFSQLGFQSASPQATTITGSTITATSGTNGLVGTPQNITISNNSIISGTLTPGPTYGRTDTITVSNSVVNNIGSQSNSNFGGNKFSGAFNEGINNIPGATMSGGVISIPKSYISANEGAISWAAPGNNMCWGDQNAITPYSCVQPFQITDVTQSGSNILFTTSLAGTWPTWTNQSLLYVRTWPATAVKFTSVTGTSGEAAMLSLADCFGLPIYTCYEVTYNNAGSASSFYWGMFGTISKLEYNVTQAYGGSTSPAQVTSAPSIFNDGVNTSLATVSYLPIANLAALGDRTLDATGGFPASWANVKSGDSLPTISSSLADFSIIKDVITNLSGDPGNPFSVKVKQITNPGLVIP